MLQIELGEELEARVTGEAKQLGISVDAYVRTRLVSELPESTELDAATVERRRRAAEELKTFARDHNIRFELPEGMTWREYIREATGY